MEKERNYKKELQVLEGLVLDYYFKTQDPAFKKHFDIKADRYGIIKGD